MSMRIVVALVLASGLVACGGASTTLKPGATPEPTVSAVSMGTGPEEIPIPAEMRQYSTPEHPYGATATKVAAWSSSKGDRVIAMTVAGDFECVLNWVVEPSGAVKALSAGFGRIDPTQTASRSKNFEVNATGSGIGTGGMFYGTLPAGAELLRIEAKGLDTLYVRPFDAGAKWQHRRFFVVNVPRVVPTAFSALDADGTVVDSYVENYV